MTVFAQAAKAGLGDRLWRVSEALTGVAYAPASA